jgi:hypothetical protein
VAVQFFPNTKNQAKSADVIFWDGSKTRKIEENIGVANQDEKADCEFVSVKALRVGDKVFTLWGEKCKQGGSTYRIHRADFGGGNGVDVIAATPTGAKGAAKYFNNAAANEMWLLPGNQMVLFTTPNGRATNIADLNLLDVSKGTVSKVIEGIVVDQYPPTGPTLFLRHPRGERLALVTRSGDKAETLYVYDLTKPDQQPVKIVGGGREDRITGLAWSNDKLFYAVMGDTQALFSQPVGGGENNLIVRGTYLGLAVNPDGTFAASSERADVGTREFRQNLVLININEESKVNLTEGAKGDEPMLPILVR